jgi:predicted transcriptional regulator
MMDKYSVTQIPVLEDRSSVGSLKESNILAKLLENRDLLGSKVSDVMDPSFPVVDVDAGYEEIKSRLREAPAVLIEEFKRIRSIITRSDLLDLQK